MKSTTSTFPRDLIIIHHRVITFRLTVSNDDHTQHPLYPCRLYYPCFSLGLSTGQPSKGASFTSYQNLTYSPHNFSATAEFSTNTKRRARHPQNVRWWRIFASDLCGLVAKTKKNRLCQRKQTQYSDTREKSLNCLCFPSLCRRKYDFLCWVFWLSSQPIPQPATKRTTDRLSSATSQITTTTWRQSKISFYPSLLLWI